MDKEREAQQDKEREEGQSLKELTADLVYGPSDGAPSHLSRAKDEQERDKGKGKPPISSIAATTSQAKIDSGTLFICRHSRTGAPQVQVPVPYGDAAVHASATPSALPRRTAAQRSASLAPRTHHHFLALPHHRSLSPTSPRHYHSQSSPPSNSIRT